MSRLFRPDIGIAAGAPRRRDDRHIAAIGRRRMDVRIDTGRRAKHAVRPCELVGERLPRLPGRRARRRKVALWRQRRRIRGTVDA